MTARLNPWTLELCERLTAFWRDGLTCSQIATALGNGISRNGVIGKAHRLKLPPRTRSTPPKPRSKRRHRQAMDDLNTTRRMHARMASELPVPPSTWAPIPDTVPIGLLDLTDATCRWPIGAERPYLFCGQATDNGSHYCAVHRQMGASKQPVEVIHTKHRSPQVDRRKPHAALSGRAECRQ